MRATSALQTCNRAFCHARGSCCGEQKAGVGAAGHGCETLACVGHASTPQSGCGFDRRKEIARVALRPGVRSSTHMPNTSMRRERSAPLACGAQHRRMSSSGQTHASILTRRRSQAASRGAKRPVGQQLLQCKYAWERGYAMWRGQRSGVPLLAGRTRCSRQRPCSGSGPDLFEGRRPLGSQTNRVPAVVGLGPCRSGQRFPLRATAWLLARPHPTSNGSHRSCT